MQQAQQQFPYKQLYQTLCNTAVLQKKFKNFISIYQQHNMHWIYQTISIFQKILNNPKQLPIIKFNTLLAIKYCFDTCQYTLITLIEVYLLQKITEIASFRSKVKDQSLLVTYFTTQGYKQSDHNDLKKISYNYVMLAIEFVYIASMIKKYRTVENMEIRQNSKYSMNAQLLAERGVKRPQKFSFFLPDYVKQNSKKYLQKLKQFAQQQICQIYSQYFLSIIITQIQTNKKGSLEIRSILSYGDVYLTSAMINLCQDQLNTIELQNFQYKKKYLGLFYEFVRWGDIQAVLMINNSDFITKISVNICNVRGDININQGENIYPEIPGKKIEKREFYSDFLKCIQTWAQCIPLNEEGLESNVRRIFVFLKEEKKFKFPENLILKRYQKELEDNLKKNDERNKKLLEIINGLNDDDYDENQDQEQEQVNNQQEKFMKNSSKFTKSRTVNKNSSSVKNNKTPSSTKQNNKTPPQQQIYFDTIQQKIISTTKTLQQIVNIEKLPSSKSDQRQSLKNLTQYYNNLNSFKQSWLQWLQTINLQQQTPLSQQTQQKIQQIIFQGQQCIQAIQLILPLMELYIKDNKINLEEMIKRIRQNLQIHQDLTMSKSVSRKDNNLEYSKKSIGGRSDRGNNLKNSLRKSLTNTIHKSILNLSANKILSQSRFNNHNVTGGTNQQNSNNKNMINSLYKSKNPSQNSSIMRKSRLASKLNKIKPQSSQIAKMIQSRNINLQKMQQKISSILRQNNIHRQPFKHIQKEEVQEYFQQHKSIGLRSQEVIREQERSEYRDSHNSKSDANSSNRNSREKNVNNSSSRYTISGGNNKKQHQSSSKNLLKHQNLTPNSNVNKKLESQILSTPSSSRVGNKSQKNITIVSRNTDQHIQILQQQSKKVVADMNLSDETNNIVVQYSDIDQEKQFQQKAKQREKQEMRKNKGKKQSIGGKFQENKKTSIQAHKEANFLKSPRKITQSQKSIKQQSPQNNNFKLRTSNPSNTNNNIKINIKNVQIESSQKSQVSQEEQQQSNKKFHIGKQTNKDKIGKVQSSKNITTYSPVVHSNRLAPLNQDYGGKTSRIKQFDYIKTPRRVQRQKQKQILQKTKKSQSKISIASNQEDNQDDKEDNKSQRSSISTKSYRQKLSNKINPNYRKSILKHPSQKSLESQIRQLRSNQINSQSSQHHHTHTNRSSDKKSINSNSISKLIINTNNKEIKSLQNIKQKNIEKDANQQYHHLPRKVTAITSTAKVREEEMQNDLNKTKKVSSQVGVVAEMEGRNQEKFGESNKNISANIVNQQSHQNNRTNNLQTKQPSHITTQNQLKTQTSRNKSRKPGISLSLGKNKSIINPHTNKQQQAHQTNKNHTPLQQSIVNKYPITIPRQQPSTKQIKFREEYFYQPNKITNSNKDFIKGKHYENNNSEDEDNRSQRSKLSNRSRIRRKLNSRNKNGNENNSDASSCSSFDVINSPTHKPLFDSHYPNKQIQQHNKRKLYQNKHSSSSQQLKFKTFIQADINKQIICPRTKQIQQIIKYGGNKRQLIKDMIKNNPHNNHNNRDSRDYNSRKSKSQEKFLTSRNSYMMTINNGQQNNNSKSRQKYNEITNLQDKLKILEHQSRNMKTKLAVKDQAVKQFKNTSSKGFVEFSTPSQSVSNYYTSSDGFHINKGSKISSQKILLSPKTGNLNHAKNQPYNNSSIISNQIKHAKSTPYKQYFQKIKGTTFKKTLLKSKSLIQKQQQIQIGCMNVRKQDYSLQVTIFITPLRFDLGDVNYTVLNDQNLIIESYPKHIKIIETKKQQKIYLNIKVKKIPFSIPEIEITYKSKNQYSTNYFRLPIPVLFNKFCSMQAVGMEEILAGIRDHKRNHNNANEQNMLMTSEFKLNTKIIKLDKVKQILPNFYMNKNKDLVVLTSKVEFKENKVWIFVKINQKNHAIIEGIQEQGQNLKYLQFLMITLKNIFEIEK